MKRTAIVPRAVFAASVALGVVPALPGCSTSTGTDGGPFAVAAMIDLGPDTGRADSGPVDAGMDATFAVAADASRPDAIFAVAVILDLGTPDAPAAADIPIFGVAVPFDV